MTNAVVTFLPSSGSRDLLGKLDELQKQPPNLPFDDAVIEFCAEFSRLLLRRAEARIFPELTALGFWMRRAELDQLRSSFAGMQKDEVLLVPRGTVFHIPPANVDTIFVYSWILSLLVGNRNIVRLPSESTNVTMAIISVLDDLMRRSEFGLVARTNWFISYGHDAEITGALSDVCSVRVVWGGDSTIATIREIAIPPHAKELTFPDRRSVAILDAVSVVSLREAELGQLAERLFNDAFWFDQLGCSSPTTLFWIGEPDVSATASETLMAALSKVIEARQYKVECGTAMKKLIHTYDSVMGGSVTGANRYSSELSMLDLNPERTATIEPCGGGLFCQITVRSLTEVSRWIDRKIQTVGYFGLRNAELVRWVSSLRGAGVDRAVPVGEALAFNRYWDGYDLLQEFSKRVYVQAGGRTI